MPDDLQLQLAGRRRCGLCQQMTLPTVKPMPNPFPVFDVGVLVCSVCGTPYIVETDKPQT